MPQFTVGQAVWVALPVGDGGMDQFLASIEEVLPNGRYWIRWRACGVDGTNKVEEWQIATHRKPEFRIVDGSATSNKLLGQPS